MQNHLHFRNEVKPGGMKVLEHYAEDAITIFNTRSGLK